MVQRQDNMKTIGILGGISWQSTVEYYHIINKAVGERLGGLHSAPIVMYSYDFAIVEQLQKEGNWCEAGRSMAEVAQKLELAGAACLIIAANTMHKVAEVVQEAVDVPLIHIVDATAHIIKGQSISKVGLLGTKYTMEENFYIGRMKGQGLDIVVPQRQERELVNNIIYEELCNGVITIESRQIFKEIISNLVGKGAQGIILGCTEIPLLVKSEDSQVPLFDTTRIHALAAVEFAMGQ